jgi:hypothetical protein
MALNIAEMDWDEQLAAAELSPSLFSPLVRPERDAVVPPV